MAVFNVPPVPGLSAIADPEAAVYLPTATGPSSGRVGYALPTPTAEANLASQIMTAMHNGHAQTIPLAGGGTLVLNGATLSFVVIKRVALPTGPIVGDPEPHGQGVG